MNRYHKATTSLDKIIISSLLCIWTLFSYTFFHVIQTILPIAWVRYYQCILYWNFTPLFLQQELLLECLVDGYTYNVSVFFGVDESASGGVKTKSIFFQDSVQLTGLVVSLIFFLMSTSISNHVFFASCSNSTSFSGLRIQKKFKHSKLCMRGGMSLLAINSFLLLIGIDLELSISHC